MKDKSEIVKIISKYAILLVVLYAIQYIVHYIIRFYIQPIVTSNTRGLWLAGISTGIVIVGNLVAMFFVIKDKKKFQIQNRFLEILTICFRPIGICILLIQIILESRIETAENNALVEE